MPTQKITKEDLLKRSISVFREKGYYRTSMNDLAKTCGLTKGAFYHHFKNKEEVMINCLNITSEIFDKNIFSIAYEKNISAEEKLKKMSKIIFKAFTNYKGGCYFANTILETAHIEDTFKDIIKGFFSKWEDAMIQIFTSKYSKKKSKELSIKSITDIEGAILFMQLYNDTKYLKDALKRIVKSY